MRFHILCLALFSCALFSSAPPAQAAKKNRAAPEVSGSRELPQQNWSLVTKGFGLMFRHRNDELDSTEPGRFFPGSVAFSLGRIDEEGHFLMFKCSSSSNECGAQRDMLEERIVYVTLLDAVRTPKTPKNLLYDARTWELTSLGKEYIEKLRQRYPDLAIRLAKLVMDTFAKRPKARQPVVKKRPGPM